MMNAGASASARLAHIVSAVRSHTPVIAGRDGVYFEAAVALILRETPNDELELLFIKRAVRADDPWSGQIAFPGGRRDTTDSSLEETAVRETREEVGFDLSRVGTIIGALDESRPRIPVLPPVIVRPFVATIAFEATGGQSDEVERYFWAPLAEILDPAATRTTEIAVRGNTVLRPAITFGDHVIWGMTEGILRGFADIIR
jgi:8-oxo-dGTP pyrophosphatase MutT (NUDIX family)